MEQRIRETAVRASRQLAQAQAALGRIRDDLAHWGDDLRGVIESARDITEFALQTRLVAANARVEAMRAGPAARGFVMLASAVEDLSGKIERSSRLLSGTIGQLEAGLAEVGLSLGTQAARMAAPESVTIGLAACRESLDVLLQWVDAGGSRHADDQGLSGPTDESDPGNPGG